MRHLIIYILICFSILNSFAQDYDELWELYSSGDYEVVIEVGEELLEIDPDGSELNLLIGRSYTDLGEPGKAIPFLENVTKSKNSIGSFKAWAYNYLGKCYYAIGNYANSKRALEDGILIGSSKNAVSSSKNWLKAFGFHSFFENWDIIESTHFVFHFSPNTIVNDKNQYVKIREKAFAEINNFFNADIPKKIDFFVWNSNQEGSQIGLDQIGFAKPAFCLLHSRYNQTVGHEMTHIISNYIAKNIEKTPFVNEGTAVCFDLESNDKLAIAKAQHGGDDISIEALWEDWSVLSTSVSYPLAGAFIERLIIWGGKEKFLEFFKDQSMNNAWSVYGIDLNNFITSFEDEF